MANEKENHYLLSHRSSKLFSSSTSLPLSAEGQRCFFLLRNWLKIWFSESGST